MTTWLRKPRETKVEKTLLAIDPSFLVNLPMKNFKKNINGVKGYAIRSSRPEVFCGKGVLDNFAIFEGKKSVSESLFNKAADLQAF